MAGFLMDTGTEFHWDVLEKIRDQEGGEGIFPVARGQYCSFAFAGEYDNYFGTPVNKIKSGLLVQTVHSLDACNPETNLVITDCQNVQAAILLGKGPYPEEGQAHIAGYTPSLIGHHLAPEGPLVLSKIDNVSDLRAQASEIGLRSYDESEFEEFYEYRLGNDSIDAFCGCKLYYPDSPGAKL